MNDRLILRTVSTPFPPPYDDITKGNVLSHNELDNNFLYLKGHVIYTAETNGNVVTLKKHNNDNLSFIMDTEIHTTGITFNNSSYILNIKDNLGTSYTADLSILASDMTITGGTYNISNGSATFTNNTGGTFTVTGFLTGTTNLGNILFVSAYGNDSTGQKGYIDKPYLTLKAARDAASSGDTIHVFPQTFIFDNRSTNSLFWNGKQADINLWKNGVTYYFEPNCKIIFYNQTISGQDLYLISPTTTTGETCTVLGHLEYEQYGTGVDTVNGSCAFYSVGAAYGGAPVNANAHTFYAEVKSLYSESCEYINIVRSVVGTAETKITIIANNETKKYISGQSGFGSAVYISGIQNGTTDDPYLTLTLTTKYRDNYAWFPFYIRGNLNGSALNIFGDVCIYRTNGNLLRDGKSTVNYTVGKTYYTTHTTGNNWYGSFVSTSSFSNGTFNVKGDLIDFLPNTYTTGVLHIGSTSHNNTINFDGNITTKTNSGIGRFIGLTDGIVTGNTINIKGDINYIGTGVTTQYMFRTNGGSGNTINYNGKITGNFAAPIANCYKGNININNSYIKSTIDGTSSSIGLNGNTSLGSIKINNSYIELKNSTNFISNGSYVNNYVNNSTIINTGGSGFSNTTSFGLLQVLNSTIITSGTSINYTSTSSVISSNSTTNNTYNINTLYGDISTITEITF